MILVVLLEKHLFKFIPPPFGYCPNRICFKKPIKLSSFTHILLFLTLLDGNIFRGGQSDRSFVNLCWICFWWVGAVDDKIFDTGKISNSSAEEGQGEQEWGIVEERRKGSRGIVLATRRGVGVLCMIGERVFGCLGEGAGEGEMGSARCQGARQGCDCTEYWFLHPRLGTHSFSPGIVHHQFIPVHGKYWICAENTSCSLRALHRAEVGETVLLCLLWSITPVACTLNLLLFTLSCYQKI